MRRVMVPTQRLKRKPLSRPVQAGIPAYIQFSGYGEPFVPDSYMANVPEPKKDPLWYMRPRLPMGVPWTPETGQWLQSEIDEWESRYGNEKGR